MTERSEVWHTVGQDRWYVVCLEGCTLLRDYTNFEQADRARDRHDGSKGHQRRAMDNADIDALNTMAYESALEQGKQWALDAYRARRKLQTRA
jgi:hypothetical protein